MTAADTWRDGRWILPQLLRLGSLIILENELAVVTHIYSGHILRPSPTSARCIGVQLRFANDIGHDPNRLPWRWRRSTYPFDEDRPVWVIAL